MTFKFVRPVRAYTMGPALYGLHGAGCGCGCAGLGSGMIANYLYSETDAAKTLAKDYTTACLVTGIASGGVAGLLGAVLKSPMLGLAAGALTGFLVYQTQRPPAP